MQEIQIFKHEVFGEIRTMTDEKGDVFFVGKDVATTLGYSNTAKAIRDHVDFEDKLTERFVLSGQQRDVIVINESGLYSLVLSSKLPQAKAFKRWVTSEVLPQIRKTGGYIPTRDEKGKELSPEEVLARAHQIVGRTLRLLNGPNCDCLTATQVAESWGMDVHSFNSLLRRMGIQYKQGGGWHLSPELEGRGLAETRHFLYYSLMGEPRSRAYLVWTPKGVQYLNNRFLNGVTEQPRIVQLNLFV
jgi:prophage antirepressor-like protein